MPGGYKIADDGRLLFVKWQGDMLDQRVYDHVIERMQDKRLCNGLIEAIDVRSATVDAEINQTIHSNNIHKLAASYAQTRNFVRIAKILIIVPDQLMFEHASDFRLLMAKQGVDVILFSSTQSLSYFLPYNSEELEDMFASIAIEGASEFRRQA